jgi:hypothetical protein
MCSFDNIAFIYGAGTPLTTYDSVSLCESSQVKSRS